MLRSLLFSYVGGVFFIPCINDTCNVVYYGFILTLLPSLARHITIFLMRYTCHNYLGSLKLKDGLLLLTTLCVRVYDPTGSNDGTLCSLSITTI